MSNNNILYIKLHQPDRKYELRKRKRITEEYISSSARRKDIGHR